MLTGEPRYWMIHSASLEESLARLVSCSFKLSHCCWNDSRIVASFMGAQMVDVMGLMYHACNVPYM